VKKKLQLEMCLTVGLMVLAVAWLHFSFELRRGVRIVTARGFGDTATFPILAGQVMLLCLVLLLITQIIQWSKAKNAEDGGIGDVTKGDLLRIFAMLVASLSYVMVLTRVGYLIASIVFMAVSLLLFQTKSKVAIVIISILFPMVLYYFFTAVIQIRLP